MIDEIFKINTSCHTPFHCILCKSSLNSFTTEEHIVPHSLGNRFFVLDKGWVCDKCNNLCSGFEAKVINHTIFGFERVRLGVITKKGKGARSKYNKISWYTEKGCGNGTIIVDKNDIERVELYNFLTNNSNKLFFPFHSKYDKYISKLLLKIGIETISINHSYLYDLDLAKEHILGKNNYLWPYCFIQDKEFEKKLLSLFSVDTYLYSHALSSNFDISFIDVEKELIMFFKYGVYLFGINLFSRDLKWINYLEEHNIKVIVAPIEFDIKK
ncbi:HNH endonuclease [Aliarcobacter butzleri]|uniref:HNH endonuclease n=1 Tax=Aliarcobacter butzleri TaxID=28197 RepID=UPI00065950B1|nr:HNH endonuclease [Aliarcobacter butzleri]KLE06640.1 hypothetical protein AF78_02550 [Aliarcobacter butzleri L353]MCG3712130.1 HNH endonuclease [Aliarcobacter butzleri]